MRRCDKIIIFRIGDFHRRRDGDGERFSWNDFPSISGILLCVNPCGKTLRTFLVSNDSTLVIRLYDDGKAGELDKSPLNGACTSEGKVHA